MVDKDNCKLYELYAAYPQSDGSWQAGSGAIFDLRSNAAAPRWLDLGRRRRAAHPAGPGALRRGRRRRDPPRHPLHRRMTPRRAYVWPARHLASDITDASLPPMGQRFRLKADFNISGYPAEVQVILQAFKEYGIILADNGSDWYISGVPDERWDNDMLVDAFHGIAGSNFEAVDSSGLMIDPNSGQARP